MNRTLIVAAALSAAGLIALTAPMATLRAETASEGITGDIRNNQEIRVAFEETAPARNITVTHILGPCWIKGTPTDQAGKQIYRFNLCQAVWISRKGVIDPWEVEE